MSRIPSSDTGPELRLRRALWAAGVRYRLRQKMPGKPDLVLVKARVAVFVDGCFWHGCPIHGTKPKSNQAYWSPKIEQNRERDIRVTRELEVQGWTVLRFWEHQLYSGIDTVVARVGQVRRVRLNADKLMATINHPD